MDHELRVDVHILQREHSQNDAYCGRMRKVTRPNTNLYGDAFALDLLGVSIDSALQVLGLVQDELGLHDGWSHRQCSDNVAVKENASNY